MSDEQRHLVEHRVFEILGKQDLGSAAWKIGWSFTWGVLCAGTMAVLLSGVVAILWALWSLGAR